MPEDKAASSTPCDLLVFDLDGTLVDSQQDLADAVNATLASLHRPLLDLARIRSFIGNGAGMLVQKSLAATGGEGDGCMAVALPYFLQYYREHNLDHTLPYPGVLSALQHIRAALPTLPMAVLTNKPVRPAKHICDGLELTPFFFEIYGGDSFPQKKPDPAGLVRLMTQASELLGRPVGPDRTVLVGDSPVDVQTARAADVRCLGCSYGLDPAGLSSAGPDGTVAAPSEWLNSMRTMLNGEEDVRRTA